MKIKILTIFTLVFFAAIVSCDGKPAADFKNTSHDFGTVKKNSSYSYTFQFRNTGSSTLIIERIKAGWGCTGTLLSSKEIPAGGSGQLNVELHTDEREGEMTKTISVFTNDPVKGIIKISIKANVAK